jgi:hypothetical protein
MNQSQLWYDSIFDAVGAAVQAAGGAKKVAGKLWPALGSDVGTARLRSGLNPDHAQKLCFSEFVMIARLAREAGDHSLMRYLGAELGYEVNPVHPIDESEQLRRDIRDGLNSLNQRLERLERIETKMRSVGP